MNSAAFECRLCFGGRLELYYRQGNDGQFRFFKCTDCGLTGIELSGRTESVECYAADYVPGHCNEFSRPSFEYLTCETGVVLLHWGTHSKKRLRNLLYNRLPIGNKARALIRRHD